MDHENMTGLPPCGDDLCAPGCTVCKAGGPLDQGAAIAALKVFPLPSHGDTSDQNYSRILDWLYDHGVAELIVDLDMKDQTP